MKQSGHHDMSAAFESLSSGGSHTMRLNRRVAGVAATVSAARTRGFTMLELLVVVAIIGLLAAYVGPRFFSQVGKSEQSVAKAQVEAFSRALDAYRLDVGAYPSTEEGLKVLFERPANNPKWNGPYLQKTVPDDPWGRPYVYKLPGSKFEYDLYTLGKDGQPGGSGDAADVGSH
jgi:general secretion pathway protein G